MRRALSCLLAFSLPASAWPQTADKPLSPDAPAASVAFTPSSADISRADSTLKSDPKSCSDPNVAALYRVLTSQGLHGDEPADANLASQTKNNIAAQTSASGFVADFKSLCADNVTSLSGNAPDAAAHHVQLPHSLPSLKGAGFFDGYSGGQTNLVAAASSSLPQSAASGIRVAPVETQSLHSNTPITVSNPSNNQAELSNPWTRQVDQALSDVPHRFFRQGGTLWVSVDFQDGSSRLESENGQVALISPDRRKRIDTDPRTSLFRLTADNQEIAYWERNSAGVIAGHFHRMKVEAEQGETLQLSKDGNTLYALKGTDSDGNAIVSSWVSESERGFMLPDQVGQAVRRMSGGKVDKIVVFQPPVLLGKIASGTPIDVLVLETKGFVPASTAQAYFRMLKVLPDIYSAFRGNTPVQTLAIENGKLEIALVSGAHATAFIEDGAMQLFVFEKDGRTALWKFNAEMNSCDVSGLDQGVTNQENGKVVFRPKYRYVKQGDRWTFASLTKQERSSVMLMTFSGMGSTTWGIGWGAVKGVGRGIGHVMTVAFSLPQTALYNVESAISFAGGIGSEFSTMQGVYTMRQATINRWVGKGLQNPKQIEEAYRTATGMLSNKSRKNVENYLDAEIDKDRQKTYGTLYWKHKDDPFTLMERANMAARKFGQANVATQYTERGGLGNYLVAGTAIAGEGYVSGAGFGAAAAPLKGLAASKTAGTSINVLNQGLKAAKAGGALTGDAATAVRYLKNINNGEMTAFTVPTAIDVADHVRGLFTDGSGKTKEHLDGIFNSLAGYGPMIGGLAHAQAMDIAKRIASANKESANTPPAKGTGPSAPDAPTGQEPANAQARFNLSATMSSLWTAVSNGAKGWLAAKNAASGTQSGAKTPLPQETKYAERVIKRSLSAPQQEALIKAHEIGAGEPGKDGTPTKIGNYTAAQIAQKARILKAAGFTSEEIRTSMERGIVGEKDIGPQERQEPIGIGGNRTGGTHRIAKPQGDIILHMGLTRFRLYRDGTNWMLQRTGDGGDRPYPVESGKPFTIGRKMGDYQMPSDPLMSAQHAEIEVDGEGVTIHDLNSLHGIRIAEQTEEAPLNQTVNRKATSEAPAVGSDQPRQSLAAVAKELNFTERQLTDLYKLLPKEMKFPDKFGKIPKYSRIRQMHSEHTVVLQNEEFDPMLMNWLAKTEKKYGSIQDPLTRAIRISDEVTSTFKNTGKLFTHPIKSLRFKMMQQRGKIVKLGDFIENGTGVCRHQAALLQVALQKANIESRIVYGDIKGVFAKDGDILQPGFPHAWVEVTLPDGSQYLLDPTQGSRGEISGRNAERSTRMITKTDSFFREVVEWTYNPRGESAINGPSPLSQEDLAEMAEYLKPD